MSAAKLLMSFIDTIAFIDMGDIPQNFVEWLNQYAVLAPLGITAKEIWEFRIGLLHMTNLSSRSVAKGTTAALIMYVGNMPERCHETPQSAKLFSLKQLLDIISEAVQRWAETYNSNPDKFASFVARYDLTVSDSRLAIIPMES